MTPETSWWPVSVAGAGLSVLAGVVFLFTCASKRSTVGRLWITRSVTEMVWFTASLVSMVLPASTSEPTFCTPLGAINHFCSVACILWSCAIALYVRVEGGREQAQPAASTPALPGATSPLPASRTGEVLSHVMVWFCALGIVAPFFTMDLVRGTYYVITGDRSCYLPQHFALVRFFTQSLLAIIAFLFMAISYCVAIRKMVVSEEHEGLRKTLAWRAIRYTTIFAFCWFPAVLLDVLLLTSGRPFMLQPQYSWVLKWRSAVFYTQGLFHSLAQWYNQHQCCHTQGRGKHIDDDRQRLLDDPLKRPPSTRSQGLSQGYGSPEPFIRSPDSNDSSLGTSIAIREEQVASVWNPKLNQALERQLDSGFGPRPFDPQMSRGRPPPLTADEYSVQPAARVLGSLQTANEQKPPPSGKRGRKPPGKKEFVRRTSSFGQGQDAGFAKRLSLAPNTIDGARALGRAREKRFRTGSDSSLGEPPSGSEYER